VAFKGPARFDNVEFSEGARFVGAIFSGPAWFAGVQFRGEAGFLQASFEGYTTFARARFDHQAVFHAIEAKSVFSLADTAFLAVPDFIQAHFVEAPRLDNSRIPQNLQKTNDTDLAARWRALKRLAIQGYDHAREQDFFKGELRARRWMEDKPWHGVFIFGLLYGWLSDFGRSLWRPFWWWVVSVVAFAGLYLCQHPVLASGRSSPLSVLKRLVGADLEVPAVTCVAGQGDPAIAALLLSLQKGLLVFGPVPIRKVDQLHACLYGIHSTSDVQPNELPGSFLPVIPDAVTAFGFVQYPLSAVLIFLLLLAIRNHFRIK
jgi:hypothetical protein